MLMNDKEFKTDHSGGVLCLSARALAETTKLIKPLEDHYI